MDAFIAWAPLKHLSLTLAYVDLGNIVMTQDNFERVEIAFVEAAKVA